MNKLKKLFITLIIITSFSLSSIISFAHPGRTDSSGGHYVRKSGWGYPVGSYHYHNGYQPSKPKKYTQVYKENQKQENENENNNVEIISIQNKLNQLGYKCGFADGKIGNKTIKAIKNFQKDNGLEPNGNISKETLEKLLLDNSATPSDDIIQKSINQFGIKSYKQLRKEVKYSNLKLECHHIIEKRFAHILGLAPDQMYSIALPRKTHQEFTNAWRKMIPYGTYNVTKEQILSAAQIIYKNYPQILELIKANF